MMRHVALAVGVFLTLVPAPAVAQHVHDEPAATAAPAAAQDAAPTEPLPPFIPPVTDAMREAAFPDVGDHAVHGASTHYLVRANHLEWLGGSESGVAAEVNGWVGRDLNRAWFRTEGVVDSDGVRDMRGELFFGRAISRWWDVVAGVRQDTGPGPDRTWAAVGVQGLAPYWFEVEATAYVGGAGRTEIRLSAEYELLVTNRLVLQPSVTIDAAGKADAARQLGAGITHVEGGLRLRYEIRRELAPYIGLSWDRAFGDTGALRREAEGSAGDRHVVVGARLWL